MKNTAVMTTLDQIVEAARNAGAHHVRLMGECPKPGCRCPWNWADAAIPVDAEESVWWDSDAHREVEEVFFCVTNFFSAGDQALAKKRMDAIAAIEAALEAGLNSGHLTVEIKVGNDWLPVKR